MSIREPGKAAQMYEQEGGAGRGGNFGFFGQLKVAPASDSSWHKTEIRALHQEKIREGVRISSYINSHVLWLRNKYFYFGVEILQSHSAVASTFLLNTSICKETLDCVVESWWGNTSPGRSWPSRLSQSFQTGERGQDPSGATDTVGAAPRQDESQERSVPRARCAGSTGSSHPPPLMILFSSEPIQTVAVRASQGPFRNSLGEIVATNSPWLC